MTYVSKKLKFLGTCIIAALILVAEHSFKFTQKGKKVKDEFEFSAVGIFVVFAVMNITVYYIVHKL